MSSDLEKEASGEEEAHAFAEGICALEVLRDREDFGDPAWKFPEIIRFVLPLIERARRAEKDRDTIYRALGHIDGHQHDLDCRMCLKREAEALRARISQLEGERDEARRFGEQAAAQYNELLAEGRILRCAFCDAEYPPDTPPTQHEALAAHVAKCEKHPIRAAKEALVTKDAEIERLRAEVRRLSDGGR